jgi:hypothetical protein
MALSTGSEPAEKPEASALPLTGRPDSYFFADRWCQSDMTSADSPARARKLGKDTAG